MGPKNNVLVMFNQNFNYDEFFRLVNFPSLDAYLASISKNEEEAIFTAEENLLDLRSILDHKLNELNYKKLRSEFKVSLQMQNRVAIHDYTTSEAAKILGRTSAAVRTYIKDGRLKSYRTLNDDYRITKESLESFITSMRNGKK